jgi:hypothetical protein
MSDERDVFCVAQMPIPLPRRTAATALFLISLVVAFLIGARISEHSFRGPSVNRLVTGGASSAGAIGQKTDLVVPGFLGRVNKIELKLEQARGGRAMNSSKIGISSCGGPEVEYIFSGSLVTRVPTRWFCSPFSLTLRDLNLVQSGDANDLATAPVKIASLSVISRLGIPVVDPPTTAVIWLFLIALFFLTGFGASRAGVSELACLWLVLLGSLAFVFFVESDASKLEPVAIVLLGALCGMALYSRNDKLMNGAENGGGRYLLALAVFLGLALRLYGIKFGLPSNFHPDEVPKVNAIMRMVDGHTLNPQYFLHPSLLLYLTYGTNSLLHFLGLFDGSFRDSAFLAGRIVSLTAGICSIILTYLIGKRLYTARTGGMAALFLAVFPLHVTCSRYLKEDSLLTFTILACVFVTIVSVQSNRRWLLVLAGVLAGCAAGTKYSGILMVVVPASAPWIASRRIIPDIRWIPWAMAAVLIAPIGFLATTPYAMLNSAKFINDFRAESRHMENGHTVSISAWSQLWMYHFWRSIWPGITGWVAVVSCVAFGFVSRRAKLEDLMILGLALLFYLPAEYVKAKPAPQPERYILPCLPFIAIALAELSRCLMSDRRRAVKGGALCGVIILVVAPFFRSSLLARDVRMDTRDRLAIWMKENLEHGSQVLMDWKPYCPNFHGQHFDVKHIPRARIVRDMDVTALRASGADYLVLSSLFYNRYFSQPNSAPALRQRFRDVFQRVPIVTQFEAPSGTYGFHNPTLTLFSLKEEDFKMLDEELLKKKQGEIQYTSNDVKARAKW